MADPSAAGKSLPAAVATLLQLPLSMVAKINNNILIFICK
jgi:hypothetical protein